MSLTRKGLKAMGLTEEQVDSIIEAHSETVDGLKEQLKTAKADAEKLTGVQKELDELKAQGNDGFKEKYEKEHKDFEDFKKSVTDKETKAAKEAAAKAYFEGKEITGKNLEIAMRAAAAEISALELDGDKIKDTAALDALTTGTLAGLATKTKAVGAQIAHPPETTTGNKLSKAEVYKKDANGRYVLSASERQKALVAMNNE